MKEISTHNGKKGGLLKGKPHYDKNGNSLGGIKAVVTDAGRKPVELEGGEVIINKAASKKYWRELSRINQSAGNGVAIGPPMGADEDPEEFKDGGRVIEFNPNHIPNKWVYQYSKTIKTKHPEIWKLGGNIFGNEAFINLERVMKRGHWLDSEEWMYIKWRSYVARHKGDFRIEGVVAMLKWCDKVDKGWAYMKDLIEEKIKKIESKKMETGGKTEFYGVSDEDEKKSAIAQDRLKQVGSMNLFKDGEAFKRHLKEYYFKKPLSDIFGTKVIITPGNFHRLVFKLKDEIAKEKIDEIFEPIIERFNKINSKELKIIEFKENSFVVEFFEKSTSKMENGGEVKKPIDEISGVLLNHLKKYSKEVYGEDIDDSSFMLVAIKKDNKYQAKELSATTKSGKEIHITVEELYMKNGGEVEGNEKHFSKLEKMESKKFAGGGNVNEYEIGTEGIWGGRGNPRIKVTKISAKTISYIDFSDNKTKFDTKEKFDRLFKPDNFSVSSTQTIPATQSIKQKKPVVGSNIKLKPTSIPSTDPSTWDAEYLVGDLVKIRIDYKGIKNGPYVIVKVILTGTSRNKNPSGKLYELGENGGSWEGKDLELANNVKNQVLSSTAQPQTQQQTPNVKKQVKTIEPEPIKRKFDSEKDYLTIFTNYFEKDNATSTKVTDKMKRTNIIQDFVLSTEGIGGFDKEKLKEVYSYINEQ